MSIAARWPVTYIMTESDTSTRNGKVYLGPTYTYNVSQCHVAPEFNIAPFGLDPIQSTSMCVCVLTQKHISLAIQMSSHNFELIHADTNNN